MIYGARVSLLIGISVALISTLVGLVIGVFAGYVRWLDTVVMRVMDGLMSIPAILLAIGLVSLSRAGLRTVIVAIVIPEVPRVVRLVRSVVLSIREELRGGRVRSWPVAGSWRHVCQHASAAIVRPRSRASALWSSHLSFLGVGIPP